MKSATSQRVVRGTILVPLDFVLAGVVMTLLGPILPLLSARWTLNDQQAGYLFTAQFATSVAGVVLSSVLVRRQGYRLTLIYGLFLMAIGVAVTGFASWKLGIAAVCLFGAGSGLNTPAANLFVAEANPERRASALNLLNSAWGLGAMACPFLVAAAQRMQRTPLFLYGVAAALSALAAVMVAVRFSVDVDGQSAAGMPRDQTGVWRGPLVPIISAVLFIYVGTENAVGGWVASYAQRIDPGAAALWAMVPSFFWGALLVGRAAAPLFLRHFRETTLAAGALMLAAAGVITLLASKTILWVILGSAAAGLGLASIFPISISLFPRWFGAATSTVAGTLFAIGNFGGAVLPWLVGMVSTHSGSLRIGFTVPLAGAALMLAFYLFSPNLARRDLPEGQG